ncbi:MAG: hypothetical protein JW810_05995, partial [Sedimentisphaerales bacterium]|nr:hypothetical protein [Sedimentisphaerales bacterium]
MRTAWVLLSLFCVGLLAFGSVAHAAPLGTTFTYQGRLTDTGDPATGPYDFIVRIYNAAGGGALLGTQFLNDVAVSDGYFTVQLDYGNVFNGDALWLDFQIRPGDGSAAYQLLTPRQPLNPTPYAMYAKNAGYATTAGSVAGGALNGTGTANYLARFLDADTLGDSIVFQDGDDIGINTDTADNYRLNVQSYNYNRAAVRGTDQSGNIVYAEGMLGMLNPWNLPYNPYNIGVLGIKPDAGADGVAVYGW